jgi:glucuronokinase
MSPPKLAAPDAKVLGAVAGRAYARAGLLGNPGDQYAGRCIAVSLANFEAVVRIVPAERFELAPPERDTLSAATVIDALDELDRLGCNEGASLLRAGLLRFAGACAPLRSLDPADPRLRFRVETRSSIPLQVGLAGSSAIVIALLRALCSWFDHEIDRASLAELALAAELEELGIQGGPMDRVTQAYGGLVWMDFAEPRSASGYVSLDPKLLPPLYIGWKPGRGRASGAIHQGVHERWLRGDADVHRVMAQLASLADAGRECLERGALARFAELVDRNFDLRAAIYEIDPSDREMVELGRAAGCAVKQCGSGGAVVGVLPDDARYAEVARAYADAGYSTVRPQL